MEPDRPTGPSFTLGPALSFPAEQVSAIVSSMPEPDQTTNSADNSPEITLKQLVVAVKNKDRDAFEALYDATVQRMYSLAFRITRRHEMAEEVISDLYLQVWRQAVRYESKRGNVMVWLTVLCRSRALDTLRRYKAATTHETTGYDTIPEIEDPQHPQDLLLAVEQQSAVHRALLKLDVQQRQLLALAYFRGYSHSELAEFTGMPVGTVKTRLRRALQTLKDIMSGSDVSVEDSR